MHERGWPTQKESVRGRGSVRRKISGRLEREWTKRLPSERKRDEGGRGAVINKEKRGLSLSRREISNSKEK